MKGLAVATKPETYFTIHKEHNKKMSAVQHITTNFQKDLIPFGLKHHVMTIKDIDGGVLYVCERFSSQVLYTFLFFERK